MLNTRTHAVDCLVTTVSYSCKMFMKSATDRSPFPEVAKSPFPMKHFQKSFFFFCICKTLARVRNISSQKIRGLYHKHITIVIR
jgi:hypothetical protein